MSSGCSTSPSCVRSSPASPVTCSTATPVCWSASLGPRRRASTSTGARSSWSGRRRRSRPRRAWRMERSAVRSVAEQAADASRSGEVGRTIALAEAALAGAGATEMRTRAVALTAIGRVQAFSRDPVAMVDAQHRLSEAATLLRPLGEPDLLLGTLQTLGYGIHYARGDLDAAIAALRDAANVDPGSIRTRAGVQTFLADALVYAGALEEAEAVLREVLGVARRLGDHRLLAYHAWTQAGIASRRGDGPAVEAWLAEAERHPADWFAHPTGIEFLADAVDHLGRVGEHVEAARYLARVEARCAADGREGIDQIALVARADPWRSRRRRGRRRARPRRVPIDRTGRAPGALAHAPPAGARGGAFRRCGGGAKARPACVSGGGGDGPPGAAAGPARRRSPPVLWRSWRRTRGQRGRDTRCGPRGCTSACWARSGSPRTAARSDPPEGRPRQLVKLLAVSGRQVPDR